MSKNVALLTWCLVGLFSIGLVVAAEPDKGPEKITIDTNKSGKRVPDFGHWAHMEMEAVGGCTTCHHTIEEGETPKACGACHKDPKDKDPETGAPGFKDAFHDNCTGCHKKQEDKKLRRCTTCHPKE